MTDRMPALFLGHSTPLLAVQDNQVTRTLHDVGTRVLERHGKPKAILAISAHWYTRGLRVQTDPNPPQIFDMAGYPDEVYQVSYPVKGCPELAQKLMDLPLSYIIEDNNWGIDYAVWTLLVHMFPAADIPVVQLSVDQGLGAWASYQFGSKLTHLRDEGYLLLGSGNVVHNRAAIEPDNPAGTSQADDFDAAVRAFIDSRNDREVLDYPDLPFSRYAVPSPEHFLPLTCILGASKGEKATVFNNERIMGSISMTSYAFGL